MNRRSQPEPESSVDEVRRKYLYRRLVINRGIKLPIRLAKKMVGPDCAYHLYRQLSPDRSKDDDRSKP